MTIPRDDRLAREAPGTARKAFPARTIRKEKMAEGEGVPTHASQHGTGGDDALTPSAIGAEAVGHTHPPLHNLSATAAPTVDDDATAGYSNGSHWVVTTSGQAWICVDPTEGAAVWDDVTAGAAGAQDVPLLDGSEHNDTVAQAPTKGSLIYGDATPKWNELLVGADGLVLTAQADGSVAWEAAAGGGGNTLDAAYDQGGAGAGRIVTVDSGAVELRHTSNVAMLATRDPGDANDRFALSRDGDMSWGSGAAAADIVLSRAAANRLAFAAGDILSVQYVADVAGTTRITTAAASPHVKVTGDLHVSGNTGERLRVGPLGPTNNNIIEATAKTPAYGDFAEVNFFKASHVGAGVSVGTWSTVRGIFGLPVVVFADDSVYGVVYGLQFTPKVVGGGGVATVAEFQALRAGYAVGAYSGTIAVATGAEIVAPAFSGAGFTITLSTGVHIGNFGNFALIADAYGLKIDDMTINTGFQRLIEVGPATPYLRLVGGGDAAAFQTNLYLKEAANLRQVQWMDPGAGGGNFAGGERVMILV